MRNEIFSRINQNRNQYYSELKRNQKLIRPEMDSAKYKLEKEEPKKADNQSLLFHRFYLYLSTRFFEINSIILKRLTNLVLITRGIVKKINTYITNKATIQSNKLTDGLIKISSQLFEDKYEYHQHIEIPNDRSRNATNKASLGLNSNSGLAIALPHEQSGNSWQDDIISWLNKLFCSFILFLESDEWFEKIERSKMSTASPPVKNSSISYSKNYKTIKALIKHISFKPSKIKTAQIENLKRIVSFSKHFFQPFLYQLKSFLTTLFPAINRFI
jgi:hypothetical protein